MSGWAIDDVRLEELRREYVTAALAFKVHSVEQREQLDRLLRACDAILSALCSRRAE